jgi:hypothetical protein
MSIEANRPSCHILWWIYSLYAFLGAMWGAYLMIAKGTYGAYPAISSLSIGFDVLGLYCLYCFLRQKPSFTRGFWILFATLYVIKLALALALLVSVAVHTTWNGTNSSHIVLMNFAGVILGVPFLVAIIQYAFRSKRLWDLSLR